jgi:hypothetical protein
MEGRPRQGRKGEADRGAAADLPAACGISAGTEDGMPAGGGEQSAGQLGACLAVPADPQPCLSSGPQDDSTPAGAPAQKGSDTAQ